MTLQIIFALYPLVVAGAALAWTLTAQPRSRSRWAFDTAAGASLFAFAFLAGPWAFTSHYLRYVLLAAFALAVLYSYRRAKFGSAAHQRRGASRLAFSTALLVIFTVLNLLTAASHLRPRQSLEVSFPLAYGTYHVLQGGNSVLTNAFHAMSGSALALDIVALNAFGNRARGIAPGALADYEVFGNTVYSPCEGTVVAVLNNVPDNLPGTPATGHAANHVTLKCGEVEVYLAHLMQRSIVVAAGMAVVPRQPLGRVGNSGDSLEPHLHIGATRGGEEIGLVFDGRWLSVNSVVKTSSPGRRDAAPGT